MANNRDPQKKYRINKRGRRVQVTSSSTRAARSKKSTVPKPTSSSTRATTKGTSKKVSTGKGGQRAVSSKPTLPQGPRQPPVQGPYQKPPKGMLGSRNAVPKKPTTPPPPTPGTKFRAKPKVKPANVVKPTRRLTPRGGGSKSGNGIKTTLLAGMATALATGALRNPVSKAKTKAAKVKAKESVGKFNTKDADGTVRSRKKVGPKKVGAKKVGPKKVGTIAESFDRAFAAARKAGKKTFEFKGQLYSTKVK